MKNFLRNQKGISIIEMLWIMCLFGAIIAMVGPMLRVFMYGDGSTPGFSKTLVNHQLSTVDESKDGITIVAGCTPSSEITIEECDAVK